MVKRLVLFDKIYNITEKTTETQKVEVLNRYMKSLRNLVQGFTDTKIYVRKLREYDNRLEINIDGPEEKFVYNLIQKEAGSITEFKDVEVDEVYKGSMVSVGQVGFGIFVDCGIPNSDVLIELRTLRQQLCKGFKKSLPELIHSFDFIDHFPLFVKIIEIDKEKKKIKGEIDEITIRLIDRVVKEGIEAIIACGATKNQFKKAIERKGHFKDVISVKKFNYLESIALLKEGTHAPGIIANVGKYLRNCKFSALRPSRIKNLYQ